MQTRIPYYAYAGHVNSTLLKLCLFMTLAMNTRSVYTRLCDSVTLFSYCLSLFFSLSLCQTCQFRTHLCYDYTLYLSSLPISYLSEYPFRYACVTNSSSIFSTFLTLLLSFSLSFTLSLSSSLTLSSLHYSLSLSLSLSLTWFLDFHARNC